MGLTEWFKSRGTPDKVLTAEEAKQIDDDTERDFALMAIAVGHKVKPGKSIVGNHTFKRSTLPDFKLKNLEDGEVIQVEVTKGNPRFSASKRAQLDVAKSVGANYVQVGGKEIRAAKKLEPHEQKTWFDRVIFKRQ